MITDYELKYARQNQSGKFKRMTEYKFAIKTPHPRVYVEREPPMNCLVDHDETIDVPGTDRIEYLWRFK